MSGDSLVMGFGVGDPDTFCALLDGLELKGGARQSLNLGVDAYGSSGSYLRLKDIAARLDHVSEVLFSFHRMILICPRRWPLKESCLTIRRMR